jgi:hypothetical protein
LIADPISTKRAVIAQWRGSAAKMTVQIIAKLITTPAATSSM